MTGMKKNILLLVMVLLLNVGVDQVSKEWARNHVRGQGTIKVLGDFFVLRYAENTGAFLGLGSRLAKPWRTLLFLLFPTVIIVGLSIYVARHRLISRAELICIACIMGGGVGNLIDRFAFAGRVTDFMNFGIGSLRTGVLNVADMSITFGAVALFIVSSAKKVHEEEKAKTEDNATQEAASVEHSQTTADPSSSSDRD